MQTARRRSCRIGRSPCRIGRSPCRIGFTLVEMLVVIAIIAILAGLLTPAIMTAMRKAREAHTANLIHQVELGAQAFMNDYGDYPPSTWAQFDEIFEYDADGNGTYVPADDWVFAPFVEGVGGGPPDLDPTTLDQFGSPIGVTVYNEGIEVLTACLVTRTGGPYLEPEARVLGNTDGDYDTGFNPALPAPIRNHVATATNWYFSPVSPNDPVFEIVDWWGNPLVYFRNDEYAAHDGWQDALTPGVPGDDYYENPAVDPPAGGVLPEWARYVSADGVEVMCYARNWLHHYDSVNTLWVQNVTGNYPKLNDFQAYSWGDDELPGCRQAFDAAGNPLGDNNGNLYGDTDEPGEWPGWNGDSGNLTNWQE